MDIFYPEKASLATAMGHMSYYWLSKGKGAGINKSYIIVFNYYVMGMYKQQLNSIITKMCNFPMGMARLHPGD